LKLSTNPSISLIASTGNYTVQGILVFHIETRNARAHSVEVEYDGATDFQWEGTVDHRDGVEEFGFELAK
jgi:hypothetical protein